jgi:polysaccharide chain length determinant protein (PEP-CTERM system associated)
MDELISQISTIVRGMWKYRRFGVLVAWLVAAIGAIVVLVVPDRYEASARIYVDTQSILKPLMSGLAMQPNVEQQINMLSRTLISRPNVEKLIRMADLDLGKQSKSEQEALIESVTKLIEIKNLGRDNLYTLSFRDSNPGKAQRVVQSLVSIFVESSLGETRKDSDTAKKFIEEQIKNYVVKLEEAEARLKDFKLKNIDLQSTDGKDMTGRLSEVSTQLNQARLELREAENARESARQQLDAERTNSGSAATRGLLQESALSVSTPELDARIGEQKRILDSLLQRFTEQHPDVVGARKLIKDLEEQKQKEVKELRRQAMANPVALGGSSNLVVQEISRLLSTSEVQVAALRARVNEYESRYAKAREQIRNSPQIETEFAQLNRDYDIHKKNYHDLVSRRESASMSGELDNVSGLADFRLIDPPRVSPKPVAPNRVLLLPLALLAALASGLGVAFLVSQVRPVFFDGNVLRTVTELPLLGVVTMIESDSLKHHEKRSLKRFLASLAALVILFLIGMGALAYRSGFLG